MNPATVHPLSTSLAARQSTPWLADVLGVAGLLFIGAQARIPLPFTPAPLTLQTLVVLAAPFLLGRDRALAGILAYLFLGLTAQVAGVFLFAAASTATYGYLAGFLLAPLVMHLFPRSARGVAAAMALASLVILMLGTLWLQLLLNLSFLQAVAIGMAPFLAGDLIKLALAYKLVLVLNARRG